jgi:ribosomal protein S18 acetylase RimI-like enzyme
MSADPDPIQYRPACPSDLPEVVELAGVCSEPHRRFSGPVIDYMATQPSCRVFVAQAQQIVGFVVVHKLKGQIGEIVAVDVAPEARDLDIGSTLLARGEEWLADNGARAIFLEVDACNEPAKALYLKLGYAPREEFRENGSVRYLMEKCLTGTDTCRLHIKRRS